MGDEENNKKRKLEDPVAPGKTEPDAEDTDDSKNDSVRDEDQALVKEKERIMRLLEPFSREQLVEILTSAATQYDNIYNEIKTVASADIAHRKVFVRGLAWETKTDHLKEAFAAFGEVEEGAVIYDKATGKSRGYGFVTFVDMESAQRAVEQQNIEIDGRKTTCNLAVLRPHSDDHSLQPQHQSHQPHRPAPPTGPSHTVYTTSLTNPIYPMVGMQLPQPQQPQQSSNSNPGDDSDRKLFVRGLSWETSDEALRAEFQKYGELEEAMVARDRKSGRSKGFGFVTFKHKAAADRALQKPQKYIDGRTTSCNLACQGTSKGSVGDRNGVMAHPSPMTPMLPTYAVPIQQVGMYAPVSTPYPAVQTVSPSIPQPPAMHYGQYAPVPDPYRQQQVYAPSPAAPHQYFQSRPPPPPQQPNHQSNHPGMHRK